MSDRAFDIGPLTDRLVALGLSQGRLSLDDVNQEMGVIDPSAIDWIFDELEQRGISVDLDEDREDSPDMPPDAYVSIDELTEMDGPPLEEASHHWRAVIARTPLLTLEQERAFAQQAREGSPFAKLVNGGSEPAARCQHCQEILAARAFDARPGAGRQPGFDAGCGEI